MSILDLHSNQAHLLHGFKTGLAAVIAYTAAQLLSLKFGYWAALSAVIVMQINVADSIRMCLYRFSGTAVGAAIGIASIMIFPETPYMTELALFLSMAFCAYMTRYNVRYKMAAITACIVLLASVGEPGRVGYGLFRVLEITLGVTSAFLTSVLILPIRASEALKEIIHNQFNTCASLYETLIDSFLKLQTGLDPDMLEQINREIVQSRELYIKVLKHESFIYNEDTELLGLKVRTIEKSVAHLRAMLHALNNVQGEGYEIIMKDELHRLSHDTTAAMKAISQDELPDEQALSYSLRASQLKLKELRDGGATKRFYLQKMIQFFAFYHSAEFMCKDLLAYTHERKEVQKRLEEK